jgi:acetyl-CoA carboxylase carboxyl transferase subunit alpha
MLENAYYSVITPEAAAAIIYRDSGKAAEAARALRLSAADLLSLGLIDGIIHEPAEGAHTDADAAAEFVRRTLSEALADLGKLSTQELIDGRYDKFRHMGSFFAEGQGA